MNTLQAYSPLQIREVFHIEFLRFLSQKLKSSHFVLKGGVNLRLYFRSPRYSEDIDIDVEGVSVERLSDMVMGILASPSFRDSLSTFGIAGVTAPDLAKAKQTQTTQRFKVHLTTAKEEDLFTKVEFSRRGADRGAVVEAVSLESLRRYRLAPLLCPHYGASAAFAQKVGALAHRSTAQARDVFDLHLLSTQVDPAELAQLKIGSDTLVRARDRVYAIEFEQFRDSVVEYFGQDHRLQYDSPDRWDEIRLLVARCIEELQ